MTDNRLKSLAERIERLMDERDGIQGDIRDIYAEAKSAGYVPKVLRKAITRKRMDPDKRSEEDTILDLYEDALTPSMRRAVQMAKSGATSREIETETGIDHATVARSVALNKKSETDIPAPQGLSFPRTPETAGAATPVVTPASSNGGVEAGNYSESCGGVESRHAGGISGEVTTGIMSGGRPFGSSNLLMQDAAGQTSAGVAPGPHDTSDEDMPEQPAFLRRGAA